MNKKGKLDDLTNLMEDDQALDDQVEENLIGRRIEHPYFRFDYFDQVNQALNYKSGTKRLRSNVPLNIWNSGELLPDLQKVYKEDLQEEYLKFRIFEDR